MPSTEHSQSFQRLFQLVFRGCRLPLRPAERAPGSSHADARVPDGAAGAVLTICRRCLRLLRFSSSVSSVCLLRLLQFLVLFLLCVFDSWLFLFLRTRYYEKHAFVRRVGQVHSNIGVGSEGSELTLPPMAGTTMGTPDVLQKIHEMTKASQTSNLWSIPTDCPQRERRGCALPGAPCSWCHVWFSVCQGEKPVVHICCAYLLCTYVVLKHMFAACAGMGDAQASSMEASLNFDMCVLQRLLPPVSQRAKSSAFRACLREPVRPAGKHSTRSS